MKKLHISYNTILLIILCLLIVSLSILSPYFLSFKNFRNILNQSVLQIILSIGMTFVICSGGMDLSIGSNLAFSSMIMAIFMSKGIPSEIGLLICIALSTAIGFLNGAVISYSKINPFIVTLSTMSIFRGATVLVSKSKPVYGFENTFQFFGSGNLLFINVPIAIMILISIIALIIFKLTKLGLYSRFIGSNESALHRMGINTKKYKTIIYSICGLSAGIAGIILTARMNTADPLAGTGYEMDAIAAVILGGTFIKGGYGSIFGTIIACFILNIMDTGLTMLSISSNYQQLITGFIIIIAAILSEIKRKGREANV